MYSLTGFSSLKLDVEVGYFFFAYGERLARLAHLFFHARQCLLVG
jgi:hypothetical protein